MDQLEILEDLRPPSRWCGERLYTRILPMTAPADGFRVDLMDIEEDPGPKLKLIELKVAEQPLVINKI